MIADGPADQYEEIWIQLREVSLIPEDGSGIVTVWRAANPDGHWIDLLKYRDEEEGEFLLTINRDVPEGVYSKVRLRVGGIYSVGGACDLEAIHLPSGKIDLNPREPIHVINGAPLWVSLDIDANKSIHLHPAGKSGKCIFRPVVFVDIRPGEVGSQCPLIVKGEIVRIADSGDPNYYVTAFVLLPDGNADRLTVRMQRDTVVFGDDGLPLDRNATLRDLNFGDRIWVRGNLDENGELIPSEIVVGSVQSVTGTVQSEGVSDLGVFSLFLDPDQVVVGPDTTPESLPVQLYEDRSLVLLDCKTEGTFDHIFRGVRGRVIGKYSAQDDRFRAVAMLIEPVKGELISVTPVRGGRDIRIRQQSGTEIVLFLPEAASVKLRGDGPVPDDLLCAGRNVLAIQDPGDPQSVSELIVEPTALEGWVTAINSDTKTLTVSTSGGTRFVRVDPFDEADTRIVVKKTDVSVGIALEDVKVGDYVKTYGLVTCESADDLFYAFIVLVSDGPEDDDYKLPPVIDENNVSLYLPGKRYEQSLIVNGNSLKVTGEAGTDGCNSEEGWTVIGKDVQINGNNAVFENIWFEGEIEQNGKNPDFINCCFYSGT
jgi:hypothetical protein